MSTNHGKYRIVLQDKDALAPRIRHAFASDVQAAHAIADALREARYSVEVWLWTRRQTKTLTDKGYRWLAGYVLTAI